uniref:dolichyl-phosphate-mannose--protein mannosyltransferase n=1 Tax=Hordeum vulgare subsp. vulgare TaxID=112509 RepID=F2E3T8_HORVV|nr:predicted protein [Hordeum vulgare subsp. vulgare]
MVGNKSQETLSVQGQWSVQAIRWLVLVSICAFTTKFYRLDSPNYVVFDEVHFGKFASWYITNTYHFDVHPPLAKMTFAAIGYLFGYDGSFGFVNGDHTYENTGVPFVQMRAVSAFCGALTAIIAYCMLIDMKYTLPIAILGSCFIVFDNYLTTMSRYILLDPQMVFYIIASCYSWMKFRCYTQSPFTKFWWMWLATTGFFLGCTLSVKLVGLSIVAVVGLCTVRELLDLSKANRTPRLSRVGQLWLARVICLILLPLIVFFSLYWIHFRILNYDHANGGETFMSERFRKSLIDKSLIKIKPVFYGSTVRIKNMNPDQKLYLHSQKLSNQSQKATVKNTPDIDSNWIIHPAFIDISVADAKGNQVLYVVKHGDYVRLEHASSGKYLTASHTASPLTAKYHKIFLKPLENQRFNQGYNETLWLIIVLNGSQQLGANHSTFVLLHPETFNFALFAPYEQNSDREFEQFEINTANISNYSGAIGAHWIIDSCKPPTGWEVSDVLNVDQPEPIQVGFYEKFVELIQVALRINSEFSSEGAGHLPPRKWPLMDHPMVWWISKDRDRWIVLLGNPFAWYISFLTLPVFVMVMITDVYKQRRGTTFLSKEQRGFLYSKGGFFLVCYLFHYVPFFFMKRILYFHHYMPGYLFSALVFTSLYQVLALKYQVLQNAVVVGILCAINIGFFYLFSDLCYATPQSKEYFEMIAWRDKWHFR